MRSRARVALELLDRVPAAQTGKRGIHQDDRGLELLGHLQSTDRIGSAGDT